VPDRSFMHLSAKECDLPATHLFNLVTNNHNSTLIYTRLLWWNVYFTIILCNINSLLEEEATRNTWLKQNTMSNQDLQT